MLQEYTHKCAIAWWGTNQNTDFHLQNFVFKNNTQFSILNKCIYFFWLFFFSQHHHCVTNNSKTLQKARNNLNYLLKLRQYYSVKTGLLEVNVLENKR